MHFIFEWSNTLQVKSKIANAYTDYQLWFSVTKQTTDAKKTN